jgi:hypothetical protein
MGGCNKGYLKVLTILQRCFNNLQVALTLAFGLHFFFAGHYQKQQDSGCEADLPGYIHHFGKALLLYYRHKTGYIDCSEEQYQDKCRKLVHTKKKAVPL